jgi:hypothetical protein
MTYTEAVHIGGYCLGPTFCGLLIGELQSEKTYQTFAGGKRAAKRVRYGGNPEHKANPGDFELEPPSSPRPDKTLCDRTGIFERSKALALAGRHTAQFDWRPREGRTAAECMGGHYRGDTLRGPT